MSVQASILLAISSMLGFGLADFMAKAILNKASAFRTVLISQSIGSVIYLVSMVVYDLALPDVSLLLLALLSGSLSAVALFSYYKALSIGKASVVSPISSCLIVVAVVLSFLVLGETLTGLQTILIVLVFLGMLLVAFERSATKSASSNVSMLFALVVVFLGGANTIIQKWIATSVHYLLGFCLARLVMVGFLLSLIPLLGKETPTPRVPRMYLTMGLLGVLDVTAFFAWFMGLGQGLVSIVTPIANSSPAVTIILAHIFLRERVLLHQKIGIVTIILGVMLLSAIS
jgi:transporter family protein